MVRSGSVRDERWEGDKVTGQMSVFDFIEDPYEPLWKKLTREGYTNSYDKMPDHPCDIDVIDREGHRFRTKAVESFGSIAFDATKGRGYDFCWWREVVKGRSTS